MKERLSALMDDALDEHSAAPLLERLGSDGDVARAWDTYHLIGDSIRGDADLHADLLAGVMSRICLLYTSPSPRDRTRSRMPSSA